MHYMLINNKRRFAYTIFFLDRKPCNSMPFRLPIKEITNAALIVPEIHARRLPNTQFWWVGSCISQRAALMRFLVIKIK